MTLAGEAAGAVLCWLATADAEVCPSVSPKELWSVNGDRIVIADVASAGSVRNVRANPSVCVSFVDVFAQTGLKCHGTALLLEPDHPDFETVGAAVLRAAGKAFPVRRLFVVDVTRTAPIRAPSYHLMPEKTVETRIAEAMETYGVRPREA